MKNNLYKAEQFLISMKRVVLSLGGSLIVPEAIDFSFLKHFKKTLDKLTSFQFVVVVGGGKTARTYIAPLSKLGKNKLASETGVDVCRLNALFLMRFYYGKEVHALPQTVHDVQRALQKHRILFVADVGFLAHNTSDGTAALLAHHLHCPFINITNVDGLYTKNPTVYKDARLISMISYDDLLKRMEKMQYRPGQHFVLDQNAAQLIKEYRITTYIIGKHLKNLERILHGKRFTGTLVSESCHC